MKVLVQNDFYPPHDGLFGKAHGRHRARVGELITLAIVHAVTIDPVYPFDFYPFTLGIEPDGRADIERSVERQGTNALHPDPKQRERGSILRRPAQRRRRLDSESLAEHFDLFDQ